MRCFARTDHIGLFRLIVGDAGGRKICPKNKIYPDRMWEQVFIGGSPVFEKDTYLNLDALIAFFHKAYSTSNPMVIAMPGKGAQYLIGLRPPRRCSGPGRGMRKCYLD
jgi:hypothetical protein